MKNKVEWFSGKMDGVKLGVSFFNDKIKVS